MKITYCKNIETGHISMVQTMEYYAKKGKSEEDILKAIESTNSENGTYKWYIEEVPESIGEVIKFLVGEDQYKASYDIGNLVRRIKSYQEDIDALSNDVYDIYRVTEDMQSDLKKVITNYKEMVEED